MTGIDPDGRERRLRWAAEQLGLSPHASADEVRAAWLRRLSADDFVPSSESRWALEVLLQRQPEGGWMKKADEAASRWEEERLRGEVEAFALGFWDLPTEERRRRWQMLTDRCTFAPALCARLRRLEAGLDVDSSNPVDGKKVIELVEHVRELFVLRPEPRARARQKILHSIHANWNEWRIPAQRLRHAYPTIAALGKVLLDEIRRGKPMTIRPRIRPQPHPQPSEEKNIDWSSLKWTWIVVGVCLAFLRIYDHKPSSPPAPPYQYDFEKFQPQDEKKLPPPLLDKRLDKPQTQDERVKELLEMRRHSKDSRQN
jgi:hypothetical protein